MSSNIICKCNEKVENTIVHVHEYKFYGETEKLNCPNYLGDQILGNRMAYALGKEGATEYQASMLKKLLPQSRIYESMLLMLEELK